MAWLMRGDDVLATAQIAITRSSRRKGLIGRERLDGVFVIPRCRHVHTFGMKFAIDVVFCDRTGTVIRVTTLAPNRISPLVLRSVMVIESAACSCDRWALHVGDVLELTP